MSSRANQTELIQDVLGEQTAAEFRETLLRRTVGLAHRRRRLWQARRAGLAMLTVVAVALVSLRNLLPPVTPARSPKAYVLVRTTPLPETQIVRTTPLASGRVVVSAPAAGVVGTVPGAAAGLNEVNDDELLAIASPRPAVLVYLAPHSAELVFLDTLNRNESQQ